MAAKSPDLRETHWLPTGRPTMARAAAVSALAGAELHGTSRTAALTSPLPSSSLHIGVGAGELGGALGRGSLAGAAGRAGGP